MARIEKKTVTCIPSDENRIIDVYQAFGWMLDSSQEVYNKDSHIEGRRDGNYSVTETTNYVKLVFARDKDMPYYEKITQLEARFWSQESKRPAKLFKSKFLFIFCVLAGAVGIMNGVFSEELTDLLLGVLFFGLPIATRIIRTKIYESTISSIDKAESDILSEVKNFV